MGSILDAPRRAGWGGGHHGRRRGAQGARRGARLTPSPEREGAPFLRSTPPTTPPQSSSALDAGYSGPDAPSVMQVSFEPHGRSPNKAVFHTPVDHWNWQEVGDVPEEALPPDVLTPHRQRAPPAQGAGGGHGVGVGMGMGVGVGVGTGQYRDASYAAAQGHSWGPGAPPTGPDDVVPFVAMQPSAGYVGRGRALHGEPGSWVGQGTYGQQGTAYGQQGVGMGAGNPHGYGGGDGPGGRKKKRKKVKGKAGGQQLLRQLSRTFFGEGTGGGGGGGGGGGLTASARALPGKREGSVLLKRSLSIGGGGSGGSDRAVIITTIAPRTPVREAGGRVCCDCFGGGRGSAAKYRQRDARDSVMGEGVGAKIARQVDAGVHGMDRRLVADMGRRFKKIDRDHSSSLDYEELCKHLEVDPRSPVSQRLFQLYDVDGSGSIEPNEFMSAMYTLARHALKRTDEMLFDLSDRGGKGYVDAADITALLWAGKSAFSGPERVRGRDLRGVDQRKFRLEQTAQRMLNKVDASRDAKLQREEFARLCKNNPNLLFPVFEVVSKHHAFAKKLISTPSFNRLNISHPLID